MPARSLLVHTFLVLLSTATLAEFRAWASPVDDPALGQTPFTGPTHPHPTSILVNPAALSIEGGVTFVYLGGGGQLDHYRIRRDPITDPDAGPQTGATEHHAVISPNGYLIGQYRASKNATLAGALSLPLDERFISDDQDLGYHTLGGHHRQWAMTVATSVRLSERLYVGAGISWVETTMSLSFLRDVALERGTAGIDGMCGAGICGIENPMAAERWSLEVESEGFLNSQTLAIRAGLVYQPFKDWWVGASYYSPPGLETSLSLAGRARIETAEIDGGSVFEANAEVVYRLPQVVIVGVRGPVLPGWYMVVSGRWQNLSRHDTLDLRIFGRNVPEDAPEWYPRYRGFRDSFSVQAGMESREWGPWRFGGRLRFDYGALDENAYSPMQVEGTSLGVVLGAERKIFQRLIVSGGYGFTWHYTPESQTSAYDPRDRLTCVDGGFVLDDCISTVEGRAIPSAAGSYGRLNHALHVSIRAVWL